MNVDVNTIASLVGIMTAIAAVIAWAYRNDNVRSCWDWIITWLLPNAIKPTSKINPGKVRSILLRRLRRDQSRSGIHYGQFGRGASIKEGKIYQTGAEKISGKPRMYLTAWPCTVLAKHGLGQRMLTLAAKGTEKLFINGRIHVYQGATSQTPPNGQPHIISYRHTMCGALLLLHLQKRTPSVLKVVDAMIDKRNGWQNADGGWAQCDREHTASDLWGSAYAIRLLAQVVADQSGFSYRERNLASDALSRTIHYLKSCWEKNKWSYGGSPSPENAVVLLIEIAPILVENDPEFLRSVVAHFHKWLTPAGNLSESYIASCSGEVSYTTLSARMSYALCLALQPVEVWHPLYLRAIENFDQTLNSADMAFLVDLSYQAESAPSVANSSLQSDHVEGRP